MAYATDADVRTMLGKLGNRIPVEVNVDQLLRIAHSEVLDSLATTYPDGAPAFTGDGLDAVRFAEAKLAAAEVLESLRVDLPTLGDAPVRLRDSAMRTLAAGVPGYPVGANTTTTDPATGIPVATVKGPRVSSFTPVSMFPDPYAPLRPADPTTYPGL